MTKSQFIAALNRHGAEHGAELSPVFSLGYVEMPLSNGRCVGIYRYNAGPRLRDQLAYLLREQDRCDRAALAVKP